MLQVKTKKVMQGDFTFTITPERIFVENHLNCFFMEPTEYYFRKRLRRIAIMVQLGHIRSYSDLFGLLWAIDKHNGRRILAVSCVPTLKRRVP